MKMQKMNVEVSPAFAEVLHQGEGRGRSAAEVTEALAKALAAAADHDDQATGDLLRKVLEQPAQPFEADEFMALVGRPALGIHMGPPRPVNGCPFERTSVGVELQEQDPHVLAECTYAEWKIGPETLRSRDTVIVYKFSHPIAVYEDVVWGRSPDKYPDDSQKRENTGRHYIASARVTFVEPARTFQLDTYRNAQGFIHPSLSNEQRMSRHDPLMEYVASHPRERPNARQPLDLLGIH